MDLSVMFLGLLTLFFATLMRYLQRKTNFGDYSPSPKNSFPNLGSIKGILIWGQWIGGYWILISLIFDLLLSRIISPLLEFMTGSLIICFPFYITFFVIKIIEEKR
jgi:hypothetical protein